MPSFDGGHYFLTALIPIKMGVVAPQAVLTSPIHLLRDELARLPKARQSPVTAASGKQSPFARNLRTHFARLFVIDDVIFQGRERVDPLLAAAGRKTPCETCDQLSCPYLGLVAAFDAQSGDDDELRGYLSELWATMGEEIKRILAYCEGAESVQDATTFGDYILKCQVDTTMPFNDYAPHSAVGGGSGGRQLLLIGAAGLAVMLAGAAPFLAIGNLVEWLRRGAGPSWWLLPSTLPLLLYLPTAALLYVLLRSLLGIRRLYVILLLVLPAAVLGAVAYEGIHVAWWQSVAMFVVGLLAGRIAYLFVLKHGTKPFPTAPNTDLKTILKALYVQQQFIPFVVAMQGAGGATLKKEFAKFVADHKPSAMQKPTQDPGTVPNA
jgi:hypothetical protein